MNRRKIMGKICGEECEIWSRVCGYYRPVKKNWNPGKKEEFKDRLTYKVPSKNQTKVANTPIA